MVEMVVVGGVRVRADELDSYRALLDARTAPVVHAEGAGGLPCPVCGSTFTAADPPSPYDGDRVTIWCPVDGAQTVYRPQADRPPRRLRRRL